MMHEPPGHPKPAEYSLRRRLLVGILLPVIVFVAIDSASRYQQSLHAANIAYDRTLLASAKTIGDQLSIDASLPSARVVASLPYAALEAFEADNRSRMVYRVSGFQGELVTGYSELAPYANELPTQGPYAALVDFYDDTFRGEPVRVAALLQPVANEHARGMAVVQVAETLELRHAMAQDILISTLWRQLALLAMIAALVVWVVQRATRSVRMLGAQIEARNSDDLTPIETSQAPNEMRPLLEATNHVMGRLTQLLADQQHFVRDASHQLRTPLAVLKVQIQSAQRGDLTPELALVEIDASVDRAIVLANQMLALAKVAQLRDQSANASSHTVSLLDEAVREVALDLAPLFVARSLDFAIETARSPVAAHPWMLRELCRNLLANAQRHCPISGVLTVQVVHDHRHVALVISDSGPGLSNHMRERLFMPFSGDSQHGSVGLGLSICRNIVRALHGNIELNNRIVDGKVVGLAAIVRLPMFNGASINWRSQA